MKIQNKNKHLQKLINKKGIYCSTIHDFIFFDKQDQKIKQQKRNFNIFNTFVMSLVFKKRYFFVKTKNKVQ